MRIARLVGMLALAAATPAIGAEQCTGFGIPFGRVAKAFSGDESAKPTVLAQYESPARPRPDPKLIAERREILRKAAAPSAVINGTELLTAPLLEIYARAIVQKLLSAYRGPRPDPTVQVRITADRYGNAFASFDHAIHVPATLFGALQSEDQLAFVLGHELAHVIKEDFLTSALLQERKDMANRVAHAGVAGAAVATTRVQKVGNQIVITNKADKEIPKAARTASMGYFIAQELADTVIAPSWTNAQEETADRLGIDLVVRAGYNPEEALNVFDIVAERNCRGSHLFSELNSSSVQNLGESVAGLVHFDGTSITFDENEAKKTVNRFGRHLVTSAAFNARSMRQNATHASAKTRASALDKYIGAHYANIRLPVTRSASINALAGSADVRSLLKRVNSSHEAREALAASDLHRAAATLAAGSDAFFAYTGYQVHRAQFEAGGGQGKYVQALNDLQAGAASRTATPAVYAALAVELANSGRGPEALARLDQAEKRFGSPEAFWPIRIAVQQKLGQRAQADATLAKCKARGGSKLSGLCEDAYASADPKAVRDAAADDDRPDAKGKKKKEKDLMSLDTVTSAGKSVGNAASSAADSVYSFGKSLFGSDNKTKKKGGGN